MKNRHTIMLVALVLLAFLPSCKKNLQTCKLGKYYLSDGNNTPAPYVFTYNADGSVTRITYANGGKDTLVYNADTLTVLSYDRDNFLTSVFTGLLNANRAVSSAAKNSYDYLGNLTATDYMLYEYNAEGRMTKQSINTPAGTSILTLVYEAGNTKTGGLYSGGLLRSKYFFYHNTAENKTHINDLTGVLAPWLGAPSANLLDSVRIVTLANTDTTFVQYTHTLDANGYISKTIETQLTPVLQSKYHTYQYFDCN